MSRAGPIRYNWGNQSPGKERPGAGGRIKKSEIREELRRRQQGISPMTGGDLQGRLERHHVRELCEGGDNSLKNQELLPIEEHLAEHWRRGEDPKRRLTDREREVHTVLGRLNELSDAELERFNQLTAGLCRRKVRFY